LPDQAQTHLEHLNVLDKLWGEISTGFDSRWRISPLTSMDLWGNSLPVVGFDWKLAPEFV